MSDQEFPSVQLSCEGAGCETMLKPCNDDNDCGGGAGTRAARRIASLLPDAWSLAVMGHADAG